MKPFERAAPGSQATQPASGAGSLRALPDGSSGMIIFLLGMIVGFALAVPCALFLARMP